MPSTKPLALVRSPTVRLKLQVLSGMTTEPLMSSTARPMFFVRYAAGSKLTVKEDIFSVSPSRAAFSRVTSGWIRRAVTSPVRAAPALVSSGSTALLSALSVTCTPGRASSATTTWSPSSRSRAFSTVVVTAARGRATAGAERRPLPSSFGASLPESSGRIVRYSPTTAWLIVNRVPPVVSVTGADMAGCAKSRTARRTSAAVTFGSVSRAGRAVTVPVPVPASVRLRLRIRAGVGARVRVRRAVQEGGPQGVDRGVHVQCVTTVRSDLLDLAVLEGDGPLADLLVERPRQLPESGAGLALVEAYDRLDVTPRTEEPADHTERIGACARRPVDGPLGVEGESGLPRVDGPTAVADLHGQFPRAGHRQVVVQLADGLRTAEASDVHPAHRRPRLDLTPRDQQPGQIQTADADSQSTGRQGEGRHGGYSEAHGSPGRGLGRRCTRQRSAVDGASTSSYP